MILHPAWNCKSPRWEYAPIVACMRVGWGSIGREILMQNHDRAAKVHRPAFHFMPLTGEP